MSWEDPAPMQSGQKLLQVSWSGGAGRRVGVGEALLLKVTVKAELRRGESMMMVQGVGGPGTMFSDKMKQWLGGLHHSMLLPFLKFVLL